MNLSLGSQIGYRILNSVSNRRSLLAAPGFIGATPDPQTSPFLPGTPNSFKNGANLAVFAIRTSTYKYGLTIKKKSLNL